jgi:hypothetical protein
LKTFFRVICPALLVGCSAVAAPPLTTIDDVLYKADGTPFNGLVTIAWTSFQAPDQSQIATQTITVPVINGYLHVQLVPTTASNPEVFYTVTYNSDGMVQFTETWSVPPSSTPLNLAEVRVPAATITGNGTGNDTNAQGPIAESGVTGLVADLSARPIKGPNFAPGAVAVVNSQGSVDSVVGNPDDCVHVDGSSGPCGSSSSASFMDGDIPSGIVDGANNSFTLSDVPNPSTSLQMYRNGLLMDQNVDYTLVNNNVVQFSAGNTPQPGDTLFANYRMDGSSSSSNAHVTSKISRARQSSSSPEYAGPQVLCSGGGTAYSRPIFGTLGTCTIPKGTLSPGDRVEIKFDLAHQGSTAGFAFRVQWGSTIVLERTAGSGDAQISGHADAGLDQAGGQVSTESWGTVLPLKATVSNAADAYADGLVIRFQGAMGRAGESLKLRNYAVIRVP